MPQMSIEISAGKNSPLNKHSDELQEDATLETYSQDDFYELNVNYNDQKQIEEDLSQIVISSPMKLNEKEQSPSKRVSPTFSDGENRIITRPKQFSK